MTSTAVLLTILAISDIVIVLTGILDSWLRFVWNVDIRISNEIINEPVHEISNNVVCATS